MCSQTPTTPKDWHHSLLHWQENFMYSCLVFSHTPSKLNFNTATNSEGLTVSVSFYFLVFVVIWKFWKLYALHTSARSESLLAKLFFLVLCVAAILPPLPLQILLCTYYENVRHLNRRTVGRTKRTDRHTADEKAKIYCFATHSMMPHRALYSILTFNLICDRSLNPEIFIFL